MKGSTQVVQVFVKTPIIGEVKTRLIPLLGPQGAYELQRELTYRLVYSLKKSGADLELWTDKDTSDPFLGGLGVPLKKQSGENLGIKMANALVAGLKEYKKVALVGADLPELDQFYLADVCEKLENFPIVVGPATDGGFGVIGVKEFDTSIFDGLRWGGSEVFRDLANNILKAGLSYYAAPTLWDIDLPDDYQRYKKWLKRSQ